MKHHDIIKGNIYSIRTMWNLDQSRHLKLKIPTQHPSAFLATGPALFIGGEARLRSLPATLSHAVESHTSVHNSLSHASMTLAIYLLIFRIQSVFFYRICVLICNIKFIFHLRRK